MEKKLTSPELLAASALIVFMLVLAAVMLADSLGLYHSWRRIGDLNALGALLLAGTPIFALVSLVLRRWNALKYSGLAAHLHQSSILYAAAGLLGTWLVLNVDEANGLRYAYATGLLAVVLLGIVVNAAMIGWLSHRRDSGAKKTASS